MVSLLSMYHQVFDWVKPLESQVDLRLDVQEDEVSLTASYQGISHYFPLIKEIGKVSLGRCVGKLDHLTLAFRIYISVGPSQGGFSEEIQGNLMFLIEASSFIFSNFDIPLIVNEFLFHLPDNLVSLQPDEIVKILDLVKVCSQISFSSILDSDRKKSLLFPFLPQLSTSFLIAITRTSASPLWLTV